MKPLIPRRWLQFSLRSLLILMLVTAAFFGGRMSREHEIQRMQAIATEVRRAQEAALYQAAMAQAQAQVLLNEALVERSQPEKTLDVRDADRLERDLRELQANEAAGLEKEQP